MVSRASYYRSTAKHAQREFGQVKAKLEPVGSDTLWLSEFVSSLQGIGSFNANSLVCLQLGHSVEERTARLRVASRIGVIRMYAVREADIFVEFRWELTRTGTL